MNEQAVQEVPARTWTEAPASLNVRFLVGGFDAQLTLRGDTGGELLKKLAALMQALREMEAQPTSHRMQPASVNGNGNGAALEEETPVCAIHGTPMVKRQNSKTGMPFWSCGTRLADGSWCPYRPAKK